MENDMYKQLLKDGVKLSIIDEFTRHIRNIDDIATLKKIRESLHLGEGK